MIKASVVEVYRSRSKKIMGYKLQDVNGNTTDISQQNLKNALRVGQIDLTNYKMTSDGRLIKFNKECYYLMNKDNVVAEFDLVMGIKHLYGKLPYGFESIQEWISGRKKFSCARDVKKFFASIGIKSDADFIDVLHCVSLQDTFWVKKNTDKDKWGNVSPFRRGYSELISEYAMEGAFRVRSKNYFSPVVSTDGSFPHTWKYNNGHITFIKAGSKYTLGGANSGQEPFSEYFASKVCEYLGFNHVNYTLTTYKRHDGREDIVTECECYTSEKYGSVSAHKLGLDSYEAVINYCKHLSEGDYKQILDMLFLDCLLLNTDRHFGNIEFIIDNDTLQVIKLAPIFDNNYSFIPRFMDGYEQFNRKDYIARDDRTFEELFDLVKKHRNYRSELIKLKGLKLEKPRKVDMLDTRLKTLNNFLQNQVTYWLTR